MFSKREKLLLKHLNEYQNETSIRDLLNCQKEQTRVNLHLMRSLESICEKTQLETKHNNLFDELLEKPPGCKESSSHVPHYR